MSSSRPNIHPGDLLREEFLKPAGVDAERLARELRLPRDRMAALIEGRGAVCIDTALRLSHFLGTSERFWLEMQMAYDLEHARRARAIIEAEVRPLRAA